MEIKRYQVAINNFYSNKAQQIDYAKQDNDIPADIKKILFNRPDLIEKIRKEYREI